MINPKRFSAPIEVPRPCNAHRLETFSPKLDRRLRLYDRAAFEWWLRLESNPDVLAFCERPGRLHLGDTGTVLIDFWVCYADREEVHLIALDAKSLANVPLPATMAFGVGEQATVRIIRREDVMAQRTWILNWERMLPFITASRGMISPALRQQILAAVGGNKQLSSLERELAPVDAMLVKGAVFSLLHEGQLSAASLHEQPLSLRTRFSPAR